MKILLTGKNGQVGWELQRTLATLGEVIALDRTGMDLANPDSIRNVIREVKPGWIVNAAAYTAVDKAESEPELAMAINGLAPGIIAEEAKKLNAAIVHYSTDYVFDGTKATPYTEDDEPNPINVYGKTKLAGERAIQASGAPHLIFRTSWVYGMRGDNFLLTILRLAKEREELRIVDDQIGAPTWCRMIAEATAAVVTHRSTEKPEILLNLSTGVYHLTASGYTSWHGFAQAIFVESAARTSGTPSRLPQLVPVNTMEYPLPAVRPANSRLNSGKLQHTFNLLMPSWQDGLRHCLGRDA